MRILQNGITGGTMTVIDVGWGVHLALVRLQSHTRLEVKRHSESMINIFTAV